MVGLVLWILEDGVEKSREESCDEGMEARARGIIGGATARKDGAIGNRNIVMVFACYGGERRCVEIRRSQCLAVGERRVWIA